MRTPDGWEGWITPGGGIEGDETSLEAAARELIEEVGVRDADLVGPIWTRRHRFPWEGREIEQMETFYLARLDERVDPVGEMDAAELAAQFVVDHRWWRLDDLEGVVTAPRRLVTFVRRLIEEGPPAEPFDVGV